MYMFLKVGHFSLYLTDDFLQWVFIILASVSNYWRSDVFTIAKNAKLNTRAKLTIKVLMQIQFDNFLKS